MSVFFSHEICSVFDHNNNSSSNNNNNGNSLISRKKEEKMALFSSWGNLGRLDGIIQNSNEVCLLLSRILIRQKSFRGMIDFVCHDLHRYARLESLPCAAADFSAAHFKFQPRFQPRNSHKTTKEDNQTIV